MILQVVGDSFVVRGHGGIAFLPVHGANFAVLLEMLEGIDDAEAFLNGTAKGHVVDHLVADGAFFVDEEEAAVGDEFSFDNVIAIFVDDLLTGEDVVGFGNRFVDVGNERVSDPFDTALVLRCVEPGPMRELGIGGAADDGDVATFKFGDLFLKAVKLGRAYEGEVLGVEEEDDVLLSDELIE